MPNIHFGRTTEVLYAITLQSNISRNGAHERHFHDSRRLHSYFLYDVFSIAKHSRRAHKGHRVASKIGAKTIALRMHEAQSERIIINFFNGLQIGSMHINAVILRTKKPATINHNLAATAREMHKIGRRCQ